MTIRETVTVDPTLTTIPVARPSGYLAFYRIAGGRWGLLLADTRRAPDRSDVPPQLFVTREAAVEEARRFDRFADAEVLVVRVEV